MHLAQFDADAFLRDTWQKRPLLIRNPWESWINPLEPDELAGLACDEGVEARLVENTRKTWKVASSPFAEKRFGKLGKRPWTLLVQAVDHHVPTVAALIEPFRFVPNWRIDDVMVSYASDGGGVGPHFDQYDVFLIQGMGRRRWRVGAKCDEASALLPHDDLRLLADFEATGEWVLEPGDILYVPPGVAHDGIAVGDDCMTYSIGFRAPARGELIAHWCDHLLGMSDEGDRYADPDLTAQDNPGEISVVALARLQAMVVDALSDREAFARWFGQYTSTPKYPDVDWSPEAPPSRAEVGARIAAGAALQRNPASRFAFVRGEDGAVMLFVDGECFDCAGQLADVAASLCARDVLTIDPDLAGSGPLVELVTMLVSRGAVSFGAD